MKNVFPIRQHPRYTHVSDPKVIKLPLNTSALADYLPMGEGSIRAFLEHWGGGFELADLADVLSQPVTVDKVANKFWGTPVHPITPLDTGLNITFTFDWDGQGDSHDPK